MHEKELFYFYLYDSQGNKLFTGKVNRKDERHKFITYNTYIKNTDEQLVIGLYGRSMLKPQGVYVSTFTKMEYIGTTFYPFHQFANFHNHLSSEKREKIEAQIKKQGEYKYNYFYSMQNVKEIDGKLSYTIELYQGENKAKNPNKNKIICVFDKNGKLLWDNALNYKSIEETKKKTFFEGSWHPDTEASLQKDSVSILHLTGEKLYFSKTQTNSPFQKVETTNSPFSPLLNVRMGGNYSTNPYQAIHWYGNHFLLLGLVENKGEFVFKIVKIK